MRVVHCAFLVPSTIRGSFELPLFCYMGRFPEVFKELLVPMLPPKPELVLHGKSGVVVLQPGVVALALPGPLEMSSVGTSDREQFAPFAHELPVGTYMDQHEQLCDLWDRHDQSVVVQVVGAGDWRSVGVVDVHVSITLKITYKITLTCPLFPIGHT